MEDVGESLWGDACLAIALLAVDPSGLGGVALRARPGPVRDTWMELARDLLPSPWRKIPQTVSEARLLGGLDLAATLKAGRPVSQTGLLAECDGGTAVLAMAERAERRVLSHLCQALDRGEINVEREGISTVAPARLALIALDEGAEDDERLDPNLSERLAFGLDLHPVGIRDLADPPFSTTAIAAARARVGSRRPAGLFKPGRESAMWSWSTPISSGYAPLRRYWGRTPHAAACSHSIPRGPPPLFREEAGSRRRTWRSPPAWS